MDKEESVLGGVQKAAPQELPAEPQKKRTMTIFQPYIGKKHSRNVYAKTGEEREALQPGVIEEIKAEIQAIKQSGDLTTIPDGISKRKN